MEDQSKMTNGTHDVDRALSTPHFDDEATLLSARPVVPFHELAERSTRRRLYFGAGLVFALLIGLAGGIFYARMEDRPELQTQTPTTPTAVQEELVSTTEAPVESSEELVSATEAPAESPEEAPVSVEMTPSAEEKTVRKIASPRRTAVRAAEKPVSRPNRRLPREAARQPRTSDDLFRIQEIFEGSSRP